MDLPLRPSEAAELANLIFDQAERRPLTEDLRNRLAGRASVLRLETITPYFGSLERDPVHPSTYYLAVDAGEGQPLLLHMALATAPTSAIFHKPLLIGRMPRSSGPEMVVNALPFGPSDHENLDKFASRTDTSFLPRPQGSRSTLTVEATPACVEAFRAILRRTRKNLAAIGFGRQGYYAGLWAAIRAGWREGYSAVAEIVLTGDSLDQARDTIRECAACTRFVVDASALVEPGCEATSEELRLAARFGRALKAADQLHETIRQTRSARKAGRAFDFEFSLERTAAPTTPAELLFCLQWLKQRGHAAHLTAPRLGAGGIEDLAAVALQFQCTLSIASHPDHTPELLDAMGRATRGRFNYKVSGRLPGGAQDLQSLAERLLG